MGTLIRTDGHLRIHDTQWLHIWESVTSENSEGRSQACCASRQGTQPQHFWYFGLDHSLLGALARALQDV